MNTPHDEQEDLSQTKIEAAWRSVQATLEASIDKPTYDSFVRNTAVRLDNDVMFIETSGRMAKDQIRTRFMPDIRRLIEAELRCLPEILVVVSPNADSLAAMGYGKESETEEETQERKERYYLSRLMSEGGFSEKMIREAELDLLQAGTDEQRLVAQVVSSFVRHFPTKKGRGLMIHGSTGTLKSTAVRAACKLIALRGFKVLYVAGPLLEQLLRDDPDLERKALAADLFAPDDFQRAMGVKAPAAVNRFMTRMLEHADQDGKPIMVSSSEYPIEIHREKLPGRIAGRLEKLFHWQFNAGRDMRTSKDPEEVPWWAE